MHTWILETLVDALRSGLLNGIREIERKTTSVDRNLKYDNTVEEEQKPEVNKDNYVEVYRKQPKVSYSLSNTLEKFLEEERRIHNPSKSDNDKMAAGGGQLVAAGDNKENVISLKAALKDPSFVQKIGQLENRRQQLYLNILKKRGQIVTGSDGSQTIVSYPKVCCMMHCTYYLPTRAPPAQHCHCRSKFNLALTNKVFISPSG